MHSKALESTLNQAFIGSDVEESDVDTESAGPTVQEKPQHAGPSTKPNQESRSKEAPSATIERDPGIGDFVSVAVSSVVVVGPHKSCLTVGSARLEKKKLRQ